MPPDLAVNLVLQLASGKADVLSGCYLSITDYLDELVQQAEEIKQTARFKLRLQGN